MDKRWFGLAGCCLLFLGADSVQATDRVRGVQALYYRLQFCTPTPKTNRSSSKSPEYGRYPGSAVYSGCRPSPGSAVYSGKSNPESAVYSGYTVYLRSDYLNREQYGGYGIYDQRYGRYYTKSLYGDPVFGLGSSGFLHGGFGVYVGF